MSILGIDSLLALNNLYVQGRAEQRSEKSEKLPEYQYRLGATFLYNFLKYFIVT